MPKPFLKTTAILILPIMALYALVLVPAFEIISCDIMLMNTLWFDAVDLLLQWTEILALVFILAALLVGIARSRDLAACRPLFLLSGGALLLKYVGAILALSVVHGSFDATLNYGSYLISLLLELLPCVLLVFLAYRHVTVGAARKKELARAAAVLGEDLPTESGKLPFKALFDRGNPLQRIVYIALGTLTALRTLAYLATEIAYSMLGFSYHVSDLPITLLYLFLLVLLPSFIGYLLCFATVKLFTRKWGE